MSFRLVDCVKQVTTTTGTADFVLGSAVAGHLSFQGSYADLESFVYEAHAVDANGARTGDWEVGIGQYHLDAGTHKLRRLFKLSGSNIGSPSFVNFSSGNKHVSVAFAASQATRIKVGLDALNQVPTFYVRADGSNFNSGLANTAEHAFATLGGALSVVSASFAQVNIVLGAGSFGGASTAVNAGPCDITITGAGTGATLVDDITAFNGCVLTLEGLSAKRVIADGPGAYVWVGDVEFLANADGHINAVRGGWVDTGAYSVSGGCSAGPHIASDTGGMVVCYDEMTLLANVTMANGWVQCARGLGFVEFDGASFALGAFAVTGPRYDIQANSVCNTHGGGASFLPGSTAGSTATGGQYL